MQDKNSGALKTDNKRVVKSKLKQMGLKKSAKCTSAVDESELSPVHTVAEKCDCRRCLAVFCDSRTFLRQCG